MSSTHDMTQHYHQTSTNSNSEIDIMFKMLKDLLNQGINSAIDAKYKALEKMFTQKLLIMLNTQTFNQDMVYEGLRQVHLKLRNEVQNLNMELRSTKTSQTSLNWT